jgi:hypothetical protein
VKHDADKLRFDLLPWKALRSVVAVLTLGARKYAVDNWRHVPDRPRRYLAAAMRHLVSHASGETYDQESGEPHLAHAACCLLFLLDEVVP